MPSFAITNAKSGVFLGVYEGEDEAAALDALAHQAGYGDYAAACEVAPVEPGEIEVLEVD